MFNVESQSTAIRLTFRIGWMIGDVCRLTGTVQWFERPFPKH
jgi:hypothetical protein